MASMLEKVTNVEQFTDEDFKTQVEAVYTQVAEKDFNLKMEHKRFWDEIATFHTYMFDRQERELETLKTLTRADFVLHFEKLFFKEFETKRLDLQLTSAAHAESQAQWTAKNAESTVPSHKAGKDRISINVTIEEFKKSMGVHGDAYKANFADSQ
jgi:secreted Zn-dependent insulinase-like peptidase